MGVCRRAENPIISPLNAGLETHNKGAEGDYADKDNEPQEVPNDMMSIAAQMMKLTVDVGQH